ncbi:MAG: 16S rRNA (guanine(527)-N(7))-methyltransferase RsmG [Cyanobacteriota bacterium]|nr:16S rRNA (guanine(527)-N(7))-methyltransferase RsmG [Cyanobacteriota bacterium]
MVNKDLFTKYSQIFIEENHKVNLISKNDEKFLWEKHICDSLALEKFFSKYGAPETLLDIGTGGGFPAVPLAIMYPQIKICALDSISKKIRAVQTFKDKFGLKNLTPVCMRVENLDQTFNVVTSRAVAALKKICAYAMPKTKRDGYFVAYKSVRVHDEIKDAQDVLKKYNSKIIDIIEYDLPLEENFKRNLVVIKKQ